LAWTARARLNVLFYANALFNALGAVILFAAPPRLDSLLALRSSSDFQWHLLAACSLSLAVVSFYAPTFKDPHAVRAVVLTFLTFNGVSAIVSVWAIVDTEVHGLEASPPTVRSAEHRFKTAWKCATLLESGASEMRRMLGSDAAGLRGLASRGE